VSPRDPQKVVGAIALVPPADLRQRRSRPSPAIPSTIPAGGAE
jgi:hypothetical protein